MTKGGECRKHDLRKGVIILTTSLDDVASARQRQNLNPGLLILFSPMAACCSNIHGTFENPMDFPGVSLTHQQVSGSEEQQENTSYVHPSTHDWAEQRLFLDDPTVQPLTFIFPPECHRMGGFCVTSSKGVPGCSVRSRKKILAFHLYFHLPRKEINFTNVQKWRDTGALPWW